MKCVILAGGRGTRIAEESDMRPKPMIEIGGKPLLWHIMKHYANHGIIDFMILGGYKCHMINDWLGVAGLSRWNIDVVFTGQDTLTGGRLLQVKDQLKEPFCLTYGDGVSNVNISNVIDLHHRMKFTTTLTAIRFPGRFGLLEIDADGYVEKISEKAHDWINGGFFVMQPEALDFIMGNEPWEKMPLQELAMQGKLGAYKHRGFWQCVDTLREKQLLESLWNGQEFLAR